MIISYEKVFSKARTFFKYALGIESNDVLIQNWLKVYEQYLNVKQKNV